MGASDSVSWAQRNEVMVVDSRPRTGGGQGSVWPLPSHCPQYGDLPFRPSLPFLHFLPPSKDLRQLIKSLETRKRCLGKETFL